MAADDDAIDDAPDGEGDEQGLEDSGLDAAPADPQPEPATARSGGQGAAAGVSAEDVAIETVTRKARAAAPRAIDVVIKVLSSPKRHSATQMQAAKMILDVAGVSAGADEQRQAAILEALKHRLTKQAYAEVVRALAAMAGVAETGALGDPDPVGTDPERVH